jgi:hypothetical protein
MRYALATLALLAGCAGTPSVDWGDYPSGTQDRIDREADAKQCDWLHDELANAKKMDNGDDLAGYINAKMKAAGCRK